MTNYDVIIIGAGIAGLSLATQLTEGKVLLIDTKKVPYRGIACAEWVPRLDIFASYKVDETLFMELIIEDEIIKKRYPGYVIDREKLQKTLLLSLKCNIHTGERAIKVEENTVYTTHSKYRGDWIVGAFGCYGPMSAKFNPNDYIPAINVRLPLKKELKNSIIYFHKEILFGYAWCFPKGDMANCGVGAKNRKLKELLLEWIRFLIRKGYTDTMSYKEPHSGLIPINILHKTHHPNHILIGDAGGFTDPLTGAGIASSIESARMASLLIKGKINKDQYQKYIEDSHLARFLKRRKKRRDLMENKWNNLKEAIEKSWISSYQE